MVLSGHDWDLIHGVYKTYKEMVHWQLYIKDLFEVIMWITNQR